MNSKMNRLGNAKNSFQGSAKKVLCVCSAGLLRSPTAANIMAWEYGFNTRSAGCDPEFALIPVDDVLFHWADEVICMEKCHADVVKAMGCSKPVIILNIPDDFEYGDERLEQLILTAYDRETKGSRNE